MMADRHPTLTSSPIVVSSVVSAPSKQVKISDQVFNALIQGSTGQQAKQQKSSKNSNEIDDENITEYGEEGRKRVMDTAVPDEESRKRGKRMMGILLKTLTEFKKEVDKPSDSDIKRAQVVQSVQEKLMLDRAEQARINEKERQERKEKEDWERKEMEERANEEFKEAVESLQQNRNCCLNFLKTKTKPQLLYLPVSLKESQIRILAEQKEIAQELEQVAGMKKTGDATLEKNID